MTEHEHTIELTDGRTLSYAELGDGAPVLVLDGPGSRGLARAAARDGYRLIAPDRPGWGKSTPKPGLTYADFADDLVELLDHVGADKVGLMSQSGGTPFAFQFAASHGDRVHALSALGSMRPLHEPDALEGTAGPMRTMFKLGRRAPWLARFILRRAARNPDKLAESALKDLPEVDAEIMKDPAKREINLRTTREIMSNSDGMVAEIQGMWRPWNVDFGAVRVPVSFWTGTRDITHPPQMAHSMADRLLDAAVHEVPGAFTFGLLPVYGDALAFCTAAPAVARR
jgi:pimeloyl-ACP methyl ester carboxylesterase